MMEFIGGFGDLKLCHSAPEEVSYVDKGNNYLII